MEDVRNELYEGDGNIDIRLYAGDTDPRRKDAFDTLVSQTRLGAGVRGILEEYAPFQGRTIDEFLLPGKGYVADLEIVISGGD